MVSKASGVMEQEFRGLLVTVSAVPYYPLPKKLENFDMWFSVEVEIINFGSFYFCIRFFCCLTSIIN